MATIYLARIAGPAGFEKPLALKVIHSHLVEDPQFIEMFIAEARIASQLQHPNIVQIFDLGESDGTYYIAMEYLAGETVSALVRRIVVESGQFIDPRMACHVLMQSCEGLHYAHELTSIDGQPLQLVHRDISPQNLFLTYQGSVKLMDFGIARVAGIASNTRPGSLKGKFSYMSPEQVRGRAVDRRSDIFGLGVVFWEMLTGRRLFKGRNEMETLRLAEQAAVVPPSKFRPGIPPELDAVLLRVLARSADERYATAMDLHEDIRGVIAQLGSALTTHELAGLMKGWFGNEIERKRSLLVSYRDGQSSATGGVGISSIPAGVSKGVGIADTLVTPSGSWPWGQEPSASQSDTNGQPIESYTPLGANVDARTSSPISETEPKKMLGRRKLILISSVILFGLGLIAVLALVVPSLLEPEPRADLAGTLQQQSSASLEPSSDPIENEGVPEGEAASTMVDAGSDSAVGGATDAGSPNTVELRLTFNVENPQVTLDGESVDSPERIVMDRSSVSHRIIVTAQHHQPFEFEYVPERDLERQINLERRAPRRSRQPRATKRRSSEDLLPSPYGS